MLRLILALAPFVPPSLPSPQESIAFETKQLAPLAARFADYFRAQESGEGMSDARAALEQSLETVLGTHPLRNTEAIGRALWLAQIYDREKLRAGKVETVHSAAGTFAGGSLAYSFRVPRDYDPEGVAYPLVLAIPDENEGTEQHIRNHWSEKEFREGAILVCPQMPDDLGEWDRVMVNGRPGGLSYVLTALRLASERFAIDYDRVFIAGRGKSVPAALAAGNYSPQRFAGIIGRSGDASDLAPNNFNNLPTLFHGAGARAREFQRTARELGFENCELDETGVEQDVWRWLVAQERKAAPSEVRLVIGEPFPTRAYWLRLSPISPTAHAQARIDRKENCIHIETEGASFVTLYLNDQLIDLSRPVTVVRNKVETSTIIPRQLSIALDLITDGTSDCGSLYVAEAVFDMRSESISTGRETLRSDTEFQERLSAAGQDLDQLWQLHLWCFETDRTRASRVVLRRMVRLDPTHAEAREALGHRYAGDPHKQWFTSTESFERFQKHQDPAVATQRGYVQHRDIWMHADERPMASKGLVKDQESGLWLSAAERRRLENGWVRQDLEWIEPEQAHHIDAGEWLVDGEWLELAAANRRHGHIERMWHIPTADILLHTTARREVAERALGHMSRALNDLRKVFGTEPALPLQVTMLSDEEQYDRFAFGDPDGKRPATHAGRLHVLHSAYFAESWYESTDRKSKFSGMGVCYWNADAPYGDEYGLHSARLAVGLSFVEAIDPSPKTVRRAESKGLEPGYYEAYLGEKILPAWLRVGGAVYAERYFRDSTVAEGGDAWWARKWSLDNLRGRGGLDSLDSILALELNPEEPENGLKLMIEAGLLVAFVVDGKCAPVAAAHEQLQRALRSKRVSSNHVEALETALRAHENELRQFASN